MCLSPRTLPLPATSGQFPFLCGRFLRRVAPLKRLRYCMQINFQPLSPSAFGSVSIIMPLANITSPTINIHNLAGEYRLFGRNLRKCENGRGIVECYCYCAAPGLIQNNWPIFERNDS